MLTAHQKLFAAEYAKDPNATRSVIAAGYSARSAHNQGSRMMRNGEVLQAIEAEREVAANESSGTPAFVYETFYSIAKNATHDRDRIHAAENIGKLLGL